MATALNHLYSHISSKENSYEPSVELIQKDVVHGTETDVDSPEISNNCYRHALLAVGGCIIFGAIVLIGVVMRSGEKLPATPKAKQMMEEVLIKPPDVDLVCKHWVYHMGLNCVNGQGADAVPGKDLIGRNLTLEQCKAACESAPQCEGVLMMHLQDPGKCWLRINIQPSGCLTNSPWDLWHHVKVSSNSTLPTNATTSCTSRLRASTTTSSILATTSTSSMSRVPTVAPSESTSSSSPASTTPIPSISSSKKTTQVQKPPLMTFYMYRAQSDANYELVNVNTANLAGVLLYLHNEVVYTSEANCMRHYDITRILRLKITMRTTYEIFNSGPWHPHFMQYVAIDHCACTVPNCHQIWDKFGYAPGCQHAGFGLPGTYNYTNMIWYSLPGPCISQHCGNKNSECRARELGGKCAQPNGNRTCTWNLEHAGEISIDELVGIEDRQALCRAGKSEYDRALDRGTGTSFWNGRSNASLCEARMRAVEQLFDRKYPNSSQFPDPIC